MTASVNAKRPQPMPGMVVIEVEGYECSRCVHQWVPRNKERVPRVCPKCKSPYWDRPRKVS